MKYLDGTIAIGSAIARVRKDHRGWYASFDMVKNDWISHMKSLAALDIALKQYKIFPTYEVNADDHNPFLTFQYSIRLPEEADQYITVE